VNNRKATSNPNRISKAIRKSKGQKSKGQSKIANNKTPKNLKKKNSKENSSRHSKKNRNKSKASSSKLKPQSKISKASNKSKLWSSGYAKYPMTPPACYVANLTMNQKFANNRAKRNGSNHSGNAALYSSHHFYYLYYDRNHYGCGTYSQYRPQCDCH